MYSLTEAGKDAVSGKDSDATLLPLEFRRLLGLIDQEGHVEVLRGRLRRFPDRLIEEWLRELAELKLIAPGADTTLEDVTFSGLPVPLLPPIPDEDRLRLAKTTVIAGATLLRSGSFISDERVANLPPVDKAATETVILVVEDDPDQLALAEVRLGMAGYQVRSVDRAKALSRTLREDARPDLLLLDVMLPDGNGFDILAQLRARPDFATLPVVLLTVKAELGDIRKGLALGADGYITKPYSKNQLAEVIGRVLKQPVSPGTP